MASLDTGIGSGFSGKGERQNMTNPTSLTTEQELKLQLSRAKDNLRNLSKINAELKQHIQARDARIRAIKYENETTKTLCNSEMNLRIACENEIKVRDMKLNYLQEEMSNIAMKKFELETTIAELELAVLESKKLESEKGERLKDTTSKLRVEENKKLWLIDQIKSWKENAQELSGELEKSKKNFKKLQELFERTKSARDIYVSKYDKMVLDNEDLKSRLSARNKELVEYKNELEKGRERCETLSHEYKVPTQIVTNSKREMDLQIAEAVLKRREQGFERKLNQWKQNKAQEKQLVPLYIGKMRELMRENAKLRKQKEEQFRQREEANKREKHVTRKLRKTEEKYNKLRLDERNEQKLEALQRKFGPRPFPRVRKYSGRYSAEKSQVWKFFICIVIGFLLIAYTMFPNS